MPALARRRERLGAVAVPLRCRPRRQARLALPDAGSLSVGPPGSMLYRSAPMPPLATLLERAAVGGRIDDGDALALLDAPFDGPAGGGRRAARRRSRTSRHVLAEGLHPADDPLPRRLPLLHVRQAAATRAARVHDGRRGARRRSRGRRSRLPRGAVHARRQARAALPRRPRGARGAGLRDDPGVPRADVPAGARGDGPAAARQPGRDDAWTSCGALREVSASQGIMLETTSERLSQRGGPHFGSPDKAAGGAACDHRGRGRGRRALHERHPDRHRRDARGAARGPAGAARRSPSGTATCRRPSSRTSAPSPTRRWPGTPEPSLDDHRWTIAVARLVLPPAVTVQAPPNLHAEDDLPALLAAGLDDWGGVSPVTLDHVNPEAPWPELERLAQATAAAGPRARPAPGRAPGLRRRPRPLVRAGGRRGRPRPRRRRRPGPRRRLGRGSRRAPPRDVAAPRPRRGRARRWPPRSTPPAAGSALDEDAAVALLGARGRGPARGARRGRRGAPRGQRRRRVATSSRGTSTTPTSATSAAASAPSPRAGWPRTCAAPPYLVPLDEIARRAREAWDRGATEICLQGGIHPAFTGDFYLDVVRAVKSEVPDLHVHAFSALEVWQGAATLGRRHRRRTSRACATPAWPRCPGTAAEILDDEVRAVLCPDKISTAQWLAVHDAAHRVGLRSTTTIMYGAVEGRRSWARHLLRAARAAAADGRLHGVRARCRSCTWRRRSTVAGAPGRGRRSARRSCSTPSPGWCCTRGSRTCRRRGSSSACAGAAEALRAGVQRPRRHADERVDLPRRRRRARPGADARAHGRGDPRRGPVPRQRTTFYDDAPADRTRASYGAPPCTEPINPPVQDAGLVRPARLLRPREPPVAG